eukprot:386704_1
MPRTLRTPLHCAASVSGNDAVITALLQAGANVDPADGHGLSPLLIACQQPKNAASMEALLKFGANPNASDADDMIPLYHACKAGGFGSKLIRLI